MMQASGRHPDAQRGHQECPSHVQLVHWDQPESDRMGGRKLRIEAGRIVWKANSRNPRDDFMSELFQFGKARLVIQDIGCSMVKARGVFRTAVPPHVLMVYETLMGPPIESDTCFICKLICNNFCPLCKLWAHPHCAQDVVDTLARGQLQVAGDGQSNGGLGPSLAHEVRDHCSGHDFGVFLRFDKASDDYPDHGRTDPPFKLAHRACLLCGSVLEHVGLQLGMPVDTGCADHDHTTDGPMDPNDTENPTETEANTATVTH